MSARNGLMLGRVAAVLATAGYLACGQASAQDAPKTEEVQKTFTNVGDIKWQFHQESGREFAFVLGHPLRPGPYIVLMRQPPNARTPPHIHPEARYVTVLSGKYSVGYGEKFDEASMHVGVAGTIFTEPPRGPHYGMAGPEGAVLSFYGVGPSEVIFLDKNNGWQKK